MPEAKGFGGRKERRSEDAVSIGSIVDDLMRREVFSRGMPVAELASKWPTIVELCSFDWMKSFTTSATGFSIVPTCART